MCLGRNSVFSTVWLSSCSVKVGGVSESMLKWCYWNMGACVPLSSGVGFGCRLSAEEKQLGTACSEVQMQPQRVGAAHCLAQYALIPIFEEQEDSEGSGKTLK